MQSAVINSIKAEIAKAETSLAEIGTNVGRNHPQRLQLEAQLAGSRRQLAMEIERISGGVTKSSRVSTQKETELRTAIEAQKKRVLDLRAQQDQINVMREDVEAARRAYDGVALKMSQTTLESHTQQTNMSVLSPAVEPTTPSRPKVLINVAVSVFAGLLLGIGAALGREFLDRRIRHRDDLAELEGIPFLGVLRPRTRYQFLKGRWAAAFGWLVRKIWDRRRSDRLAQAS
jgi:uncharacterized protein involved in exopolysaccharide biosynthesis